MAKGKSKNKKKSDEVNESVVEYRTGKIVVFKSFQEQEAFELEQMALLSPVQILKQLRKFINIAYGIHGYDPKKLPKKHSVRIISGDKLCN